VKCKQHTSWGNKNVQNWQNVNSVLLGSDAVPTKPVWLGMAYSRGVMPFNHLVNRVGRTYSKGVMSFNQMGLKGSNTI
jgi:hypothetical protein